MFLGNICLGSGSLFASSHSLTKSAARPASWWAPSVTESLRQASQAAKPYTASLAEILGIPLKIVWLWRKCSCHDADWPRGALSQRPEDFLCRKVIYALSTEVTATKPYHVPGIFADHAELSVPAHCSPIPGNGTRPVIIAAMSVAEPDRDEPSPPSAFWLMCPSHSPSSPRYGMLETGYPACSIAKTEQYGHKGQNLSKFSTFSLISFISSSVHVWES